MEYIKKEDLKDGDIFVAGKNYNFINKKGTTFSIDEHKISRHATFHKTANFIYTNIRSATVEQKHWLNTCIKLDKFITFEEAMKTFIPEYVECVESSTNGFTENKIYKIEKIWNDNINFQLIDNDFNNRNVIMIGGLWSFKPSTKEAYDAQFVVKEPLPQFKVIESIETITKVENNEGNQFFIGDVVISSNGTIQTIESFGYNTKKTNIIAFTNKQSILGNGIGIGKIEHYIEPAQVEPEFVLPEYWAIRITEESYEKLIDWRIKLPHSSGGSFDKNSNIDCFLLNIDGNCQGYWCKSLEDKKHIEITFEQFKKYVLKEEDKPKVGDKFKFKKHDRGNFIIDKIQDSTDGKIIFYNQYEKYNANHNRVLLKNIKIIK